MTFVLSQIDSDGIIMASDSSETHINNMTGDRKFVEVEKTIYFKEINIGISTWGDAEVNNQGINDWLEKTVTDFKSLDHGDNILEEITYFLATKLDNEFSLDGKKKNNSVHMGLHVAGYNSISEKTLPGICHVFIEPGFTNFDPQMTMLSLPNPNANFHLRNGMYEEFAVMWPALSGIDASFRALIAQRYQNDLEVPKDPILLKAEWLGNCGV